MDCPKSPLEGWLLFVVDPKGDAAAGVPPNAEEGVAEEAPNALEGVEGEAKEGEAPKAEVPCWFV